MSISLDPSQLMVKLLDEAQRHMDGGNLGAAMQLLDTLVSQMPGCDQAWFLLGKIALQAGDVAAAMDLLAHANRLAPAVPDYLLAWCEACVRGGRLDQAMSCYVELEQHAPAQLAQLPAATLAALLPLIEKPVSPQPASPLPASLLPLPVVRAAKIRDLYQQAILHCALGAKVPWWNQPELPTLFLCESIPQLRYLLRIVLLHESGDWRLFLRLTNEIDRLGEPAADEDRFLLAQAQRYCAEQAQGGADSPGAFAAWLRQDADLGLTLWSGEVSALAMMNGLLALHAVEVHAEAQHRFADLHREALRIWQSGRHALSPATDRQQLQQIVRMLWHFDLLAAAQETLVQASPGHFLIPVLEEWQQTKARNVSQLAEFRQEQGGETYLIGATVWGDAYLDFFLDYHLPALLAAGNLPQLARRGSVIVSVVTDAHGRQRIENAAITARLRDHARLHFSVVSSTPRRDDAEQARLFYMHYGLLDHHHVLLAQALAANLLLLPVDTVISACGLSALARELDAGYDCCTIAGVEAYQNAVVPQLASMKQDAVLSVGAAALATLAMAHKTDYFRSLIVDERSRLNAHPREFFWRVPGGYVCHSIFMHPLMLSARVLRQAFHPNHENTDWALLPRVLQGSTRVKVLDDSRELFILHCSEDNARAHEMSSFTGLVSAELGVHLLSVHQHDFPIHRHLFRHGIFFPVDDPAVPVGKNYLHDTHLLLAMFSVPEAA